MANFGIKGALDLLKRLNPKEQERLLNQVSKSDSQLAKTLREQIVSIRDLKKFTDIQWLELITNVSFEDIAYALMPIDPKERLEMIAILPEITQKKILGILDQQVIPMARLNQAREKVLEIMEQIHLSK
ncbi:MAG: FliG C-terminal domain-containing protein [Bacteriovoracaceae bacterium]|nr:FliG C-terminal domain-containing protein [Bacteriovoracaceae bacterium]